MENNQGSIEERNKDTQFPAINTGNASNPLPHDNNYDQASSNQLLNKKAEKYIREAGNIEDVPDPQEQQEAEDLLQKENNNG